MNAADRRMEIVSILAVSGHVTARELAREFGVCMCTIRNDITYISYGYPIYTKPGLAGEFLSWTGTNRTTILSRPTSKKNSKKCMTRRREKIKKSWNGFSENMGRIS